jgi:hypothetical protein
VKFVLLVLLLAVGAVWFLAGRADRTPLAAAAAPPAQAKGQQFFGRVDGGASPPSAGERARRRQQLLQHYQRAERSFCNYREGSKYPAGSRPIGQNPDQVYPNRPVMEMNPMRVPGGASNPDIRLQTSQSRIYMASGEAVTFSLRAVDAEGRTVPLVVTRAVAQGVTFGKQRPATQVPLTFVDAGDGADPVANDGSLVAVLNPGKTGLASFNGTIAADVQYTAGGSNGVVQFEVVYSPEWPATWAGQVREAQEDGSLAFYLRADVREPGRYVISGRVDDARGRPFALATFNDLLGPGMNDVRLTVFGKLMRDGAPAMPLTLRDVDGYLLKENADPDRALMPRLEGTVHASKVYPLESLSDAEWQSEERSRYLNEFAKDLRVARSELARFDPSQPLPAGECDPAGPTR